MKKINKNKIQKKMIFYQNNKKLKKEHLKKLKNYKMKLFINKILNQIKQMGLENSSINKKKLNKPNHKITKNKNNKKIKLKKVMKKLQSNRKMSNKGHGEIDYKIIL